jgi:carbonic anhydrase
VESTLIDKHMEALFAKKTGATKPRPRVNPPERPIIISCISPDVDPADIFGLAEGEAYVIRAAGNIVTQETVRSIVIAMVADRISDIIILGHTNCTNANKGSIYSNLDRFVTKLPSRSILRETLATREKASKYFGIYDDEIDNIHVQVENLKFFKAIQPGLNVSGMLYNKQNGHVYTLGEVDQLRKLVAKDPKKDINTLIPTRYTAFAKGKESDTRHGTPQQWNAMSRGSASTSASDAGDAGEEVDEKEAKEKPQASLPAEFVGQQLAFEKLMEAMQKSIAKVAKVRVFTPKIRMPHIKGITKDAAGKAPPA